MFNNKIYVREKKKYIKSNEELFSAGDIETLYKRNKNFVFFLANKFSNIKLKEDDFIGCGDMAFTKAIAKYDPDKSRWVTFFSKIMINEILQENRIVNKRIKTVSLEAAVASDEDNNKLLIDNFIISPEDTMDEALALICREEILELIQKLPEKKRKILLLHIKGKRHCEIAVMLNMNRNYVGKIVRDTALKLKNEYFYDENL